MSQRQPPNPPSNLLSALEGSLAPAACRLLRGIRELASRSDIPLYLVGGPVRDLLLGRPAVDLDLVMEGDAATLAFEVAKELAGEVVSYRQFGTATVKVDQQRLDLVTARRETYLRPGALPKVTPSAIEDDLHRRDFTINAMAIRLSKPSHGQLLDPTGGMEDLERGLIRALHRGSFRDDATRILRAIRYEVRLDFCLESDTKEWLLHALEEGILATVSADRLRREVGLILRGDRPVAILRQAGELGVLRSLYKPLGDASRLEALASDEGKEEPLLYLAALAHPLSAREGEAFIARLSMPVRWAAAVRDLIVLRDSEGQLAAKELSPALLSRLLDNRSHAAVKALTYLTPSAVVRDHLNRYLGHLRYVKPLLRGGDLMDMGVPQGPKVGQILSKLKDARLEGRVTTRKEETDLAMKYLTAKGG